MPTESAKLIKIGEAAKLLGVSVRTLRYWEEKGFLTAVKTPGGTRMYRQADLLGFDKFNLTSEKIDTAHENSVDSNFSQPKVGQTKDLTDEKLPNKNFNNLEARDIVSSTNPNRQWEDTFSEEPLMFQAGEAVISADYVNKKARFGLSHPRYKSAGLVTLFMTIGILTWWGLNGSNMFRNDQSISLLERFVARDAQTQNSALNSFSKKIITSGNNAAVLAAVNPNFVLTVNVDTDIQAALSAQSMTLTDASNQLGLGNGLTISGTIQNNNVIASIPTLSSDSEFLFTDQTQTLSNKTISGNTNTITNIPNSALSNSSITINTSGTLSGGGIVSLGGSITLTGASSSTESSGVSSITGTAGQVIASGSTGAVTLSLPQSIAPSSTVQFGNIGIGTTQANEALDVNGRLYIYDTSAPAVTANRLYSVGGVLYWDGANLSGGSTQYWSRSLGILSPATSSDGLSITGGATLTGTLNFNNTGTSSTAIGNSSGTVTIASGGTTSWTNTAGNLTVSTSTSGTLAITSAGALNLTGTSASYLSIPTNSAGAFKIWDGTNNLISFDTRIITLGVAVTTLTGIAPTIASASTSEYTTVNVSPPTITLTGGTNVTSAMDSVLINQPTITDASAVTIDEANTFTVAGAPIPAGSATITRAVGLRVAAGAVASGATNAYGLFVDAPTSGSANYSAVFNSGNVGIGTTTPGSLLQVAGAVRLGVASGTTGSVIYQNSSNANTTTIQSGAPGSSITLTLPTSTGSNGDCLQTNGAGGVLSFGACTGGAGGGVTSLNGLSGILTLANSTGSGATITIDNAAADGSTKGIAAFNSTNFSASSGVINTIQGISTAASPSFTGLSLTGLSSSTGSGLCVSAGVVYTCSSGSSAGTLQSDYDNGNTIATSTGKDIAFTLSSGLASPTQFSLTQNHTSGTNAFYLNNANASGTNTNGILVEQTGAGTLTNGINITRTAGTLTNGLTFTGTFTNLINSTNFSVSNAGAVTAVGVNSGSGLLQGTGGITLTGTANINATGTSLTNLGNSTGVLTIASGGSSGWTNTSGTLTLSTASSGAINLTSAHTAGQTTTAAFNIKTSTDLGVADEVLQIGDSAADFLTVLGGGNVGIGTTNPGYLLNLFGTSGAGRFGMNLSGMTTNPYTFLLPLRIMRLLTLTPPPVEHKLMDMPLVIQAVWLFEHSLVQIPQQSHH
jgi:hypothetical protein